MNNLEIERKFLVDRGKWAGIEKPEGMNYQQGYLCIDEDKVIRVRVAGGNGFLTIKGSSDTFSHPEYEYEIPLSDAKKLISAYTGRVIKKRRFRIPSGNHTWEVDVFEGENEGLIVAEIELNSPEETFDLPAWIGKEVTSDKRYYNAWLSLHPFSDWPK
jgi:CYTH domain-containing protein